MSHSAARGALSLRTAVRRPRSKLVFGPQPQFWLLTCLEWLSRLRADLPVPAEVTSQSKGIAF